jgi:hypothetical protein
MIQANGWRWIYQSSLGYDGFAFLEGSFRSDRSSTLQKKQQIWLFLSIWKFSFL